jgi:3-phosphoshikimate 1-carboxyvinyltransferase
MSSIQISKIDRTCGTYSISLPSSKSISNRALILHKLSGGKVTIENLSEANDTKILWQLLQTDQEVLDAGEAGTSLRFILAYCCVANKKAIVTGSSRMKQRPIGPLVSALNQIGFKVEYVEQVGYPPVKITPLKNFNELQSFAEIDASVSSQFISALVLVAPFLPYGLTIRWRGHAVSEPYIFITVDMLRQCGIEVKLEQNEIRISPGSPSKTHFVIEPDWTNAFYWGSICALHPGIIIQIPGLKISSLQGDAKATKFLKLFGVDVESFPGYVRFVKSSFEFPDEVGLQFNFSSYPDLAQTFMVLCAAKNIPASFIGLATLSIKETDRIAAMQRELRKCGVELKRIDNERFQLSGKFHLPDEVIETYGDHRMAMSFATLSALGNIQICQPKVVEKSYPDFWGQLGKIAELHFVE